MSFLAGDVIEVVANHPTYGDCRFAPKAGEAFTLDNGGYRTADDATSTTANGQNIRVLSKVRWSLEGNVAVDQKSRVETNYLKAVAGDPNETVWTMTHVSGAVSKGTGSPVGDLNWDSMTSQLKLKVAGGGDFETVA